MFYQAAHCAGLDATLAGPEPYTVLILATRPSGKVEGALKEPAKPAKPPLS
jgi:hypothetical protein